MRRESDRAGGGTSGTSAGDGARHRRSHARGTGPTVLMPEDVGYSTALYPYEERRRRWLGIGIIAVGACLALGGATFALFGRGYRTGGADEPVHDPPVRRVAPGDVIRVPSGASVRSETPAPETHAVPAGEPTANATIAPTPPRITTQPRRTAERGRPSAQRTVRPAPTSTDSVRSASSTRSTPRAPATVRQAAPPAGGRAVLSTDHAAHTATPAVSSADGADAPAVSSTVTCATAYDRGQWQTAATACEREARTGNTNAQRNLGVMYGRGLGVTHDDLRSVQWLRRAADGGSRDAQYQLGVMYQSGRGVARDESEAVRWFQRAAARGDPDAQVHLALAYLHGAGVPMDVQQALAWLHKAAGQNDLWAQNHLGWMYANGEGVPVDYVEAVHWFRLAAERGDAQAQYNLGYMYLHGLGVQRSLSDAVTWYRKAAAQGSAKAREALRRLYPRS